MPKTDRKGILLGHLGAREQNHEKAHGLCIDEWLFDKLQAESLDVFKQNARTDALAKRLDAGSNPRIPPLKHRCQQCVLIVKVPVKRTSRQTRVAGDPQ
ncbi:hypothetical protein P0D71_29335 [Paraburkholderia sp. RL17-383-BIF-A]|nr:hypothetical protein [Burkholderia sp. WP9]SEF07708.1 hypothetical protein SAMN02787142_7516 [Burkholderia sp. WP9]